MKTPEQELQDIETLARATNRALADLLILHEDAKALLRKIYNRANPSLFDDASQTRLDSDLMDEIEAFLQIRHYEPAKETRPD